MDTTKKHPVEMIRFRHARVGDRIHWGDAFCEVISLIDCGNGQMTARFCKSMGMDSTLTFKKSELVAVIKGKEKVSAPYSFANPDGLYVEIV